MASTSLISRLAHFAATSCCTTTAQHALRLSQLAAPCPAWSLMMMMMMTTHWSHNRRLKRGLLAQRGGVVEDGSTEPLTRPECRIYADNTDNKRRCGCASTAHSGKILNLSPAKVTRQGGLKGARGCGTVVMCCKSSVEKSHQL